MRQPAAKRCQDVGKDIESSTFRGEGVLYMKALSTLKDTAIDGRVSFPDVNHTLSWLFHLNKKETRLLLKELQALEVLNIIPYRGVVLKNPESLSSRGKRP